ncbi:arginase [Ascoidea rubescens DSM 1968]|uniref:Arginase n=1 Tax=Ascoidea rubescens DSM 1968 TaxID=1344418 RepID=A0A1D2VLI7_9ASCO|nr:arginase [Ascoidea rubescens DSM 1968]ODV62476.1 arginase [Ascoidea rubescens DSM 1968]
MTVSDMPYKFYPNKSATIISAPFSGGQDKPGVEHGPSHLLAANLQSELESLGWDISLDDPLKNFDYQEYSKIKDVYKNCKKPKLVSDATNKIYNSVKNAALSNNFPITIGGDHSIAIGTVAGVFHKYPDSCLLWIDAHADINTPLTTSSGNLHGCPISFLMGLDSHSYPPHLKWIPKCLSPGRIAYIGLRDVDDGEKKILRELNIAAYSMYHVDKYGINNVVQMALRKINPHNDRPIHLSYDVDAIDPLYVPATGTPVRGGLTLREGLFIAEAVAETGNLAALDIVEVNPSLARNDVNVIDTVGAGLAIAKCAFGDTIV